MEESSETQSNPMKRKEPYTGEEAVPQKKSMMDTYIEEESRKVRVGNLPPNITREELYKIASEYGNIEKCYLPASLATKQDSWYGYVTFKTVQDSDQGVQGLNGKLVDGKTLYAKHVALQTVGGINGGEIDGIVKNLVEEVTKEKIEELFLPFGGVTNIKFCEDAKTNQHNGQVYVTFPNKANAILAISKLSGFVREDISCTGLYIKVFINIFFFLSYIYIFIHSKYLNTFYNE